MQWWRPEKMNQMTNRQGNTSAPSSGEPPALPWHRNGEADDLVGDPGPGQVHPQLESVAESHPQFTFHLPPAPGDCGIKIPGWVSGSAVHLQKSAFDMFAGHWTICVVCSAVHPSVVCTRLKHGSAIHRWTLCLGPGFGLFSQVHSEKQLSSWVKTKIKFFKIWPMTLISADCGNFREQIWWALVFLPGFYLGF